MNAKVAVFELQANRLRRRALRSRRWSNATLYAGLGLIILVVVAAAFAPLLTAYNPTAVSIGKAYQPPSWAHLMGTDNLGRDVFTRVLYGARIDLQIGVITTYVPVICGVLIGSVAGYFGHWVEAMVMRVVDVLIAFPFIVLVIAIIAIVGPGLMGMYIGVIAVGWSMYARLARGEMLVLRNSEFIEAAKVMGLSRSRIIVRHAIPNLWASSLVFSMADFILNIILAASLSFLGLGVQPPTPEWGAMMADGQNYLANAWWIATLPGLAIVYVGIALSLIGDGLAERLGEEFRLTV